MTADSLTILVAEDEETDVFLLQRAFQLSGLTHRLIAVSDGQQAVDYLAGTGPYSDRAANPLPALIVLDLKMPLMSGFDVLSWLNTQPALNSIPAVVLSSSSNESDISRARQLGARDYFVKPFNFSDLVNFVHQWQSRWLAHPKESGPIGTIRSLIPVTIV